jgi:hypothetical protein
MGCAVAATSMGPPGSDFGALFGAGRMGNTAENGWSWTAPWTQLTPTEKTPSAWNWDAKAPERLAESEHLLDIPLSGEELVEESRLAFENLLQGAEAINIIGESDVATLSEFLTSSADEPAAENLSRLIQWLSGRSVDPAAWQAVTALTCDKIKLASIDSEELLEVIRGLPRAFDWQQDDSARQRLHEIYHAFNESIDDRNPSAGPICQTMFEEIYQTVKDAQSCYGLLLMLSKTIGSGACAQTLSKNISLTFQAIDCLEGVGANRTQLLSQLTSILDHISPVVIKEVLGLSTRQILENGRSAHRFIQLRARTWLECLAHGSLNDHMSSVYAELAKRLRPYQLREHFASYHQPYDVVQILLRDWLPYADLDRLPDTYSETNSASNGLRQIQRRKYGLRKLTAADLPVVAKEFERLDGRLQGDRTWMTLLQAFARTGVSYEYIVRDVFDICKARYDCGKVFMLFLEMLNEHDLAIPNQIPKVLIQQFLAEMENALALKLFWAVPSLAITDVPKLALTLLEDSSVRFDLFSSLLRQANTVRMEDRETHKLGASPELVDLVHLIAHNIARSAKYNPRQAYRHTWSLYRWLQDRGAPLNPLISRAIVTAGIMRPIQDHIWIPNEKLDYILSIVERVEGVEIRKQVEQLATHMRNTVHGKVLAKRDAREQNAWMGRMTEMANKTQYRVKKWTKKQPVPTSDGRSYWAPREETRTMKRLVTTDDGSSYVWAPEDADRVGSATQQGQTEDMTLWRPTGQASGSEGRAMSSFGGRVVSP